MSRLDAGAPTGAWGPINSTAWPVGWSEAQCHRTVTVEIDLRRYHSSASLSERVSFVARTPKGYVVYALGH